MIQLLPLIIIKHGFEQSITISSLTVSQRWQVMRFLLAAAANVNARCDHRATPLSWAAISDNAAAVGLLLEAKVDPLLKARPESS